MENEVREWRNTQLSPRPFRPFWGLGGDLSWITSRGGSVFKSKWIEDKKKEGRC